MIELPKQKDGIPLVSYSQISSWFAAKAFNLSGRAGKDEYIQRYFLGKDFGDDMGWAEFGNRVESAIEKQDFSGFSDSEAKVLESIQPLPIFQYKMIIPFEGFNLIGYIDNCNEDLSQIIDFKTASEKSVTKYYTDDYKQLDVYALGVKKLTGKMPKKAKVLAILRKGNPFRGEPLEVDDKEPRYINREINKVKLEEVEAWIYQGVNEISDYYKVYKKLIG